MKDLRKVAKPSKDNWKLWVNIGNDLIDEYEEILGLSEPEIDDTGYRDKIRDSITSVKDMFALLEAESAFKKRQKRKDLDDRWNYWKKVIIQAYKTVPGPAKDAFKNIIRRRDKIYFAATDSSDPALGGSSGFDPGTTSTGTFTGSGDDVERDAMLANLPKQSGMGMQSQIDPSNRVSKDQKDRDGHLERIKNIVYVLDTSNLKKAISKGRAEVEDFLLTDRLPTKEIRKYTTKYYALVAEKFGLQGLLFKGNIYFADGSSTKADPNDEIHKEIAQAQHELGALDNRDAIEIYGLKDLPSQSGMSQQMQAGTKGFKRDEVKWNGKPVPALNKYNWKQWIELGQTLLDRIKKPSNEPLRGNPTESIRFYLNTLVEKIEMSDQDKANWKLLQQQFTKVKKELPPEALKAYRDLQDKKRTIELTYDLPGQSGMGMQSQIDPSNRVSKDQKDRDGYAERVKNLLYTFSADSGDLKNSVRKAKRDLRYIIAQLPNKEAAKYSTMFYSELASKLGVQGLVRSDHIVFADGSKEKVDANNDTHKEIVQAQFDLDLIDSTKANKLVDLFGLNDLPSQSGMSQQMQAGTKGFKNTGELKLKGTSKTLPPLTSDTYKEYVTAYQKILRKYKSGSGKGGGYKDLSKESIAEQIRHTLNLFLVENPMKINQTDAYDLAAIEKAFQIAAKRKAIKPAEHDIFKKVLQQRDEITKQSASTKGNTPDTLKKAMAIKAPGSDTNYGVFNDQVMAVLNNPTPENLIKQAEAAAAMDLDGFDTDRMKFSAFYGHVAKAMGLTGLITHRNSFMNSPMVVSSKARKTDFSNKMPDMLPFGEYSVEAVDFDNLQHKAVAQAQLNKNLLPASIQMSSTNTVDDVYKRFGITKQEPQEPEKTGDVKRTVKWGGEGKPSEPTDLDAADAGQAAAGGEDPEIDAANQPEPDASQRPDFTGTRKELPPTDKLHYERFIPLPTEINNLLKLPQSRTYYVDRIRDSESNAGANISDTLNIVSEKTANGGSYKIARQISKDMSQAAYKAIIDMLKSRNLEFIDQAQAKKFAQFKATNAELDANKGDPGETGDLWSQSQFGKDALAKKKAERERKFNYAGGLDKSGSGVGSPGTETRPASDMGTGKPPGKAVYYEYINSSGRMKKRVWVERDANGTVVNRGKEGQEYTGTLPTKNEYRNRQEATTASHSQGGGQGGNNLGAHQGTGNDTGGQALAPTNQAADSEAIQKIVNSLTNTLRQMQSKPIDKEVFYDNWAELFGQDYEKYANNPNTLTQTQQQLMNQAIKLKGQIEELRLKQQTTQAGVGTDSSHPVTTDQRPQGIIPGLNAARDELDQKQKNDSTDFTRLLKNAGLLKEFY